MRIGSLAAVALICSTVAAAAQAQTQTVDTWIGRLQLDVGYPSKATVEKLYGEMDFQRATQAFIWALPAVGFQALHLAHLSSFGAKDGDVVLYEDLKDKEGMLTPNITTLYAFSFSNMKEQGPLVVEVPAGATAGGILDIWQRPWPLAARAQQADGARRIGVLLTRKADDPEGQKQFGALRRGLLELGWSEGKTIISKCAGRLPMLRRR